MDSDRRKGRQKNVAAYAHLGKESALWGNTIKLRRR